MNSLSPLTTALRWLRPHRLHPGAAERGVVERVFAAAHSLAKLPDSNLVHRLAALREQVGQGADPHTERVLVPACALVFEAARRVLGTELYSVQLLSAIALVHGAITEMQTGEGKTFAAMVPAVFFALRGGGVHVMTVNAYLARRDYELLQPVYRCLGMTTGLVESEMTAPAKRDAYACDITYGTGYEFGFDYLRDQLAWMSQRTPEPGNAFLDRLRRGSLSKCGPAILQRGHAAAIIDEADSVLIDEATTPLVIAAECHAPAACAQVYHAARQMAEQLERDCHFVVDEATMRLQLTEAGLQVLEEQRARIPAQGLQRGWATYVEQALRSKQLHRRDKHYVVVDGEVRIVDESTGRVFADRTWREGLHQAIQAKEGVTITAETKSAARITRQRYFQQYRHLCGLTGTAQGSESELSRVYGLNTVIIPTHRPCRRTTLPLRSFGDRISKERAILAEIAQVHSMRRPILVGTPDIETSERLARKLQEQRVPFQLLNGKQDSQEAALVARAGQLGAVTIATNMAGRGTDIELGTSVAELGGLHVIATEPQESSRIDRQLVGRAARQGEPGSNQIYASADDSLFQFHAPALASRMRRLANGCPEIRQDLSRQVAATQARAERTRARQRLDMYKRDDWQDSVLRQLAGASL